MKKNNWKKVFALVLGIALMAAIFSGCAVTPSGKNMGSGVAGTVLLSVNPEIEVDYDENGLVVEVEGKNGEGEIIVQGLGDCTGKTCREVVEILVREIYDAGYFSKTIGGHERNIVIKLQEGSAYPSEQFLDEVAQAARNAVQANGVRSETVTVGPEDQDDQGYITLERAKEIVLTQLGLADAVFNDRECRLDGTVYELEFVADGIEYEYEVDARTGKVLEVDMDRAEVPVDPQGSITLEEAKTIALNHLGLTSATFHDRECKLDDGVYELEFVADGVEYDCEVDARTGQVLEIDRDYPDNDWDDPYDDDDDWDD